LANACEPYERERIQKHLLIQNKWWRFDLRWKHERKAAGIKDKTTWKRERVPREWLGRGSWRRRRNGSRRSVSGNNEGPIRRKRREWIVDGGLAVSIPCLRLPRPSLHVMRRRFLLRPRRTHYRQSTIASPSNSHCLRRRHHHSTPEHAWNQRHLFRSISNTHPLPLYPSPYLFIFPHLPFSPRPKSFPFLFTYYLFFWASPLWASPSNKLRSAANTVYLSSDDNIK